MDQQYNGHHIFKGRTVIIATMHGKEKVFSPILEKELGVKCLLASDFNTDAFGTFTGEVVRKDTPGATMQAKALAALQRSGKTLVVASEGSFGAHSSFSYLPANEEMVILIDLKNDLEIWGRYLTEKTNFNHREIKCNEDLEAFKALIGYPQHAIILQTFDSEKVKRTWKDFSSNEDLKKTVQALLENGEHIRAESDMRAMRNPTRMRAIEHAVRDLVNNIKSLCPSCNAPGFVISDVVRGLPCGTCNLPTNAIKAQIYSCKKCGYRHKKCKGDAVFEDPAYCDFCNP